MYMVVAARAQCAVQQKMYRVIYVYEWRRASRCGAQRAGAAQKHAGALCAAVIFHVMRARAAVRQDRQKNRTSPAGTA